MVFAYVPLLAAGILLGLILADLVFQNFIFWPPPRNNSWQDRSFIWLFRIMVYGLLIASIEYFLKHSTWTPTWMFGLGVLLIVIGFTGGFIATFGLGWKNAFGSKEGLRTDGLFRYSRNPVYVATWFGLAGWAIVVPAPPVVATLLFWGLGYLGAIFLEERWLRLQYDTAFDAYCKDVPRFLALRR